jgi:peptidyl-prolyl cis-trans isomerase SurA
MNGTRAFVLGAGVTLGLGSGAMAQDQAGRQQQPVNSTQSLRLPQNPEVFGSAIPSVIKATAIVNGEVITQTDVQQRVQLLAIANGGQIPP